MTGRFNQQNLNPDPEAMHARVQALLEAYVLDAVDVDERQLVDAHLLSCSRCEHDVERIANVVHAIPLALSADETPAPDVRDLLFARIASVDRGATAVTIPPFRPQRTDSTETSPAAAVTSGSRWMKLVSMTAVAPLVLALIMVSAWANSLNNQLDDTQRDLEDQQNINETTQNGARVQLYTMQAMCSGCEGNGRVGIDQSDQMGMVVAWNLDPSEEHQVWCSNNSGEKAQVTNLMVNADGGAMGTFALPTLAGGYSRVYLQADDGTVMYISDLGPTPEGPWASPAPANP